MNYAEELRSHIGQTVEVVAGDQVATGVLTSVTDELVTLNAAVSGYGNTQIVTYQLDRVTYVRVL